MMKIVYYAAKAECFGENGGIWMDDLYIKLVNHLSNGASIISPDGRTIFMNEAFQNGIAEKQDFIYSADLFSQEYLKKLSTSIFMQALEEKREVRGSQLYMNEDKQVYNVMLRDKPILDEDNNVVAVLACAEYILPMGKVNDLSDLLESGTASTFIFESPAMRKIVERMNRVAKLPASILLLGESGVGKDKMAEYIHSVSDRAKGPFVVVNCAAIAENLIESELFGYESGAFTGAGKGGKKGLIESSDGGTIFLDEINSMPLGLQGKLLRTLETKKVRRVGGNKEYPVDFRLITASNRDLMKCVENGTFREDLYYRINVFSEEIPPLRERREDIGPLLDYFTKSFAQKYQIFYRLNRQDLDTALSYHWPGNIRELRNFAEQIVVVGSSPITRGMAGQKALTVKKAPEEMIAHTLKQRMAYFEREIIQEALKSNRSKKDAAKELGIDPAVLSRKIMKYGLKE